MSAKLILPALVVAVVSLSADAAAQVCGRIDGAPVTPAASDALGALRASVGTPGACRLCLCDVDGSGAVTANDALAILRKSVGLDAVFSCGACSCTLPERLPVGKHPRVVVIADVNGDGIADLLSADDEARSVSLLPGTGNGRFGARATIDVSGAPLSVTAADVNGDEALDLVTANLDPSSIAVLEGRGDGTFAPARLLAAGDSPIHVAVGDLDGDGHADLVAANSLSNDLSIYLADGEGGFAERPRVGVGIGPRWLVLAELTGDDKLDAVTANRESHSVTVLPGLGDGSFAESRTIAVCAGAHHVVVADLDSDDKLDLVVPCKADGMVAVLIGRGTGEFEAPRLVPTDPTPISAAVGDLDGDGNPDAGVTHWYGRAQNLVLLRGTSDGSLAVASRVGVRTQARGVAFGDLTGDGRLDIVTANTESDDLLLFRGNGQVDLGDVETTVIGLRPRVRDIAAADFDGDGATDFVTVSWHALGAIFGRIPDFGFGGKQIVEIPRFPSDVVTGDFNGDGKADFVVKNNKVASVDAGKRCTDPHLALFRGRGDATFEPEIRVAAANLTHHTDDDFVAADVDQDGIDDLVIIERRGGTVTYMRGRQDGQFEVVQRIDVDTAAELLATGDVNADGAPDIAFVQGADGRTVIVRLRDDRMRFGLAASATIALDAHPAWLVIADVDGDRRGDIVAGRFEDGEIEVHLSGSDGTFTAPVVSNVGRAFFRAPELVDADVDGLRDLVGLQSIGVNDPNLPAGGGPAIALGTGGGRFGAATAITPGSADPSIVAMPTGALLATNLDDDPSVDLVVAHARGTHGAAPILFNVGHCLDVRSRP